MTQVRYEIVDHVAEIALDNAPVNALTEAMIGELLAALSRAKDDPTARAVILYSAVPKRFCAGLDLDVLNGASSERIHSLLDKLYTRLCEAQFHLGKPSIAAVNGSARGGGMTLAVSCDMIVASRGSTFGYPEIDVGLLPAIHFTHLPRIVGRHRAFDLLFTGRTFDAEEALRLGLIARLVDNGTELQEARAVARTLAAKSPTAMRLGRAAFTQAVDNGYRQGVAGAVETFCNVAVSTDGREGVSAFSERREPSWQRQ